VTRMQLRTTFEQVPELYDRERVRYSERPERFEYRLTEKGRELGVPLLALMQWGDRYISEKPPRIALRESDRSPITVRLVADDGSAVRAGDVELLPGPRLGDHLTTRRSANHGPGGLPPLGDHVRDHLEPRGVDAASRQRQRPRVDCRRVRDRSCRHRAGDHVTPGRGRHGARRTSGEQKQGVFGRTAEDGAEHAVARLPARHDAATRGKDGCGLSLDDECVAGGNRGSSSLVTGLPWRERRHGDQPHILGRDRCGANVARKSNRMHRHASGGSRAGGTRRQREIRVGTRGSRARGRKESPVSDGGDRVGLVGEEVVELRRSLTGAVFTAADAGYDGARRCFNALVDRRPAVIARCHDADDVATAFAFARSHSLEVAVRGGGHNPAGHCLCERGLVIDLSLMRRVEVDGQGRVARAEGGATWLDYDSATQAFGLVTPGGVVGSTGVAGLTLGGGIGHLTAQFGLTCDNLISAEVVTPDGTVVRANAEENPELLWGLRGGGGNLGVATRLEFRLHPLDRVLGGRLTYAGRVASEALRLFRDLAVGAPHDLSCQAALALDESLQPVLAVAPSYTGRAGDPAGLRALRSLTGLADGLREHSFLAQQHVFNPGYGVDRNYWKGHFVRELPDELLDELLRRIIAFGRPPGQILIESLHGAPKDTDPTTAALGFREAAFNVSVMAAWIDPALDERQVEWARETAAAIEPWSVSGGYINYMQADEPIERVRAAFGAQAFERLQALKRRYDPNNVLRRNQNIPPQPRS
jgi:FAD/FMN-containing dehydrogenase